MSKRIRMTKSGKFIRTRANKSHILTKKSRKRKRNLRQDALVSRSETQRTRRMLPYG